ncbi:Uu.00g034880.m01.CDS01 [Anthostomella pinea]|uniref:Uu.00g034880.m01.CDS01 n=1 Tax=Anthostomella pinea TaxID=933095 RepID=A0AAI8VA48_9PEZI|nr:Uu.00g034880.m01.CDS01 [Anthostomella pinea]
MSTTQSQEGVLDEEDRSPAPTSVAPMTGSDAAGNNHNAHAPKEITSSSPRRTKQLQSLIVKRDAFYMADLCIRCGKAPYRKGMRTCEDSEAADKLKYSDRRTKARCTNCGKALDHGATGLKCPGCKEKQRHANAVYKEKRKAEEERSRAKEGPLQSEKDRKNGRRRVC